MQRTAIRTRDDSDAAIVWRRSAVVKERLTTAVMRHRYPMQFNIPKHSRHQIEPTLFLPTHRISSRIEGMTLFWPSHGDLHDSVNRIPAFGGRSGFFAHMRRRLAAPACRRIVAMSQFARHTFEATHADAEEAAALSASWTLSTPTSFCPSHHSRWSEPARSISSSLARISDARAARRRRAPRRSVDVAACRCAFISSRI